MYSYIWEYYHMESPELDLYSKANVCSFFNPLLSAEYFSHLDLKFRFPFHLHIYQLIYLLDQCFCALLLHSNCVVQVLWWPQSTDPDIYTHTPNVRACLQSSRTHTIDTAGCFFPSHNSWNNNCSHSVRPLCVCTVSNASTVCLLVSHSPCKSRGMPSLT